MAVANIRIGALRSIQDIPLNRENARPMVLDRAHFGLVYRTPAGTIRVRRGHGWPEDQPYSNVNDAALVVNEVSFLAPEVAAEVKALLAELSQDKLSPAAVRLAELLQEVQDV